MNKVGTLKQLRKIGKWMKGSKKNNKESTVI